MTLVSKTLAPNGALVDPSTGRATPPFNNYLNSLTILANTAAGGTLTTGPGSGLQGGGDISSNLSISIAPNGVTNQMIRQGAAYSVIGRQFGTTGDVADITADADNRVLARISGVLAFYDFNMVPATVADGNYGDVTVSLTGTQWTINSNVVTNAKLAQVATATFKGRTTAGTGNVEDLTGTQATALLNVFSSTLKGLAPLSGGGTVNYLRADGTWAAPPGATSGTVTSVSVVTANGVSGTVATATTTPAITLTLGAITPSSVLASGTVAGSNLSGTNTGDQTITLTGDVTGSGTGSFAATIGANKVTFAKFVAATQKSLVGATAAGNFGEITLGSGVAITAGVLSATGTGGTVTTVSVVTANGFSGTVANATTTPAITLSYAGAALTKADDTNVTLTLGGTPATALLQAASLSLGWTGILASSRGGTANAFFTVSGPTTSAKTFTFPNASDTVVCYGTAGTFTTAQTFPNTGLKIKDTDASNTLAIVPGSDLTADRTLTVITGDASRAMTFYGDASLGRTITGTTNRLTVTNGDGASGNPTLDISTSYAGQATIVTVGTVTSGTWQGTAVAAGFGGTGIATYAIGDLLQASASTTLSKLAAVATGNVLISGGVTTVSSWGKVGLTTHVSGTLPIANGGTNQTSLGNITKTDDTNVTLTLGGTPTGAVITSTSFALGWTGTLSVARGGTGNAGGAWTAFTPTITSGSGTIVTVSASGAYQIVGKLMNVRVTIMITLAGTGAGTLNVTNMPGTATVRQFMGGVEDAVAVNTLVVGKTTAGSTNLEMTYSGGATVIATGARVQMTGAYEIS